MSDSVHPLKTILQLQLASDNAAVLNSPYVIQFLSPQHLQPSPHLQKWITRINSLIHSKDPGARWAGLSIACQTAIFSREILLENARSWVSAALPLLSKQEPLPTLKAATRLLTHIFSVATDTPEFQRQIASPNVPKFSLALVVAAEDHPSRELKLLSINALSVLAPLYPTLYKALHGRLSALCIRQFNGSAGQPTDSSLAQAASRLYSVLPATGGKVGSISLWRKSVDEVLSIGWASLYAVRTTYPHNANIGSPRQHQSYIDKGDIAVSIPLNVDRLRCVVLALCDLLIRHWLNTHQVYTSRAVRLPLGVLVGFSQALLSCTYDGGKGDEHIDPSARAMEAAATPEICALGSDLLSRLAACAKRHLTPHAERFTSIILFHLEQTPPPNQHVILLRALMSLLTNIHTIHLPVAPNRITKVLLSTLSLLLPTQSDIRTGPASVVSSKSGRRRKRAHDYEGDEIFKITTNDICPTLAHREMILATLDTIRVVLHNPCLAPTIFSLASRVLLGLSLSLSSLDPARLSHDLAFHAQMLRRLQVASLGLAADAQSTMGRGLSLSILELLEPLDGPVSYGIPSTSTLRELDRLLHPRAPPLVRSLPHVGSLSLFRAEESVEEQGIRESFGIGVIHPSDDIEITDAENQQLVLAPLALASLPPRPSPNTLADVSLPKAQEPALLHANRDPSPSQISSQDNRFSEPNNTLRPLPAREMPPSFMSGNLNASEVSRLGVAPEVINPVEEEDEEMPSIDMGSDSD
ncbi:rRNA processing/ribosome biogenesis-domain-containing protein [Lactifluus subvellereus]|nr:rRNA processing/ribosome biogenesis-domain-containing protein [Lactifluus subvellereus]